jgi:hypothetical protein
VYLPCSFFSVKKSGLTPMSLPLEWECD